MGRIDQEASTGNNGSSTNFDAIVVGAGFAGLYSLYRLRENGFSVRVFEQADEVGGTWYFNRYPGCRCDTESHVYQYSFCDELLHEWEYSMRYPEQDEILEYFKFAADKLDLRRDIEFETGIDSAEFHEEDGYWSVQPEDGSTFTSQYLILSVGPLSKPFIPDFEGIETYDGEWYHTARWPHEPVDLQGDDVGVIGTGSTGVQLIPEVIDDVAHLTVYQRTPNYIVPAQNRPLTEEDRRRIRENYDEIWERAWNSASGHPHEHAYEDIAGLSESEIVDVLEERWEQGGFRFFLAFERLMADEPTNRRVREFITSKIRDRLDDPELAETLVPDPDDYPYGAKRPPLNYDEYFKTFERDDVTLVDVSDAPIERVSQRGIRTTDDSYEHDKIVFATGFDAITGGFTNIDITGRNGTTLDQKWADGAESYIGMGIDEFPNMFMISGPQSVSAISNQPVAIEQQVEWIDDCLDYIRSNDLQYIEPARQAVEEWVDHSMEVADKTLFTEADSWFKGANIPDKPTTFLLYVGGFAEFTELAEDIAANGYEGFRLSTDPTDIEVSTT